MIKAKSSHNYDSEFERLYQDAHSTSYAQKISFMDSFKDLLESRKYTTQPSRSLYNNSTARSTHSSQRGKNTSKSVFLLIGETGMGKSSLANSLLGYEAAQEGDSIKSKTFKVKLYSTDDDRHLIIDTPGFFDTRRLDNENIPQQIVEKVQTKLREDAHIDAIFFLWCPNYSAKLRLDSILNTVEKVLGEEAISSMIFWVNKVSSEWNERHRRAVSEFRTELKRLDMNNPVVSGDVKLIRPSCLKTMDDLANQVESYKEEDFAGYRRKYYYDIYLKVKEEHRKEDDERRRVEEQRQLKIEMEQIRRENQRKEEEKQQTMREKKIAEDKADELRRSRENASYYNHYSYRNPFGYFDSFPSYLNISPVIPALGGYSSNQSASQSSSAQNSTEKFYRAGQFIPGGGRAPKGGIKLSVSKSATPGSVSVNSASSQSSGGGKFYKGGQFMSGGGRAPRGGAWG